MVFPSALGKTKKAKVNSLSPTPSMQAALLSGKHREGEKGKEKKEYFAGKGKLKIPQSSISLTWGECEVRDFPIGFSF